MLSIFFRARRVLAIGVIYAITEWVLALRSPSDSGDFRGPDLVFMTGSIALVLFAVWALAVWGGHAVRLRREQQQQREESHVTGQSRERER